MFWEPPYNDHGGLGFAVATDGPADPTVLCGGTYDGGFNDWDDTGLPLSSFPLYAVVADILSTPAIGCDRVAHRLSPAEYRLVVDRLLPVDDPLFDWENNRHPTEYGVRFWCDPAGDVLAYSEYIGPGESREGERAVIDLSFDLEGEYDDAYAVKLVTRTPAALEPFDRLGLDWLPG
jgi:hypothetical protein